MIRSQQILVFRLHGENYALGLEAVERVFRAVAVTPLPHAPERIIGVVNVQGRVLPVFNLRRSFQLPEADLSPSQQMILARTRDQAFVVVADEVVGVVACRPPALIAPEEILPHLDHLAGVVKLADGLVFIHDIDSFFTADESAAIRDRLTAGGGAADG